MIMVVQTQNISHDAPKPGYFGSIFPYCSPVSGGGGVLNQSNWLSDSLRILPEKQNSL